MIIDRDFGRPPLTLVLGGQRSGKSAWAEGHVVGMNLALVYVATAEARDGEMAHRIAHHRARRGDAWRVIEEPLALAEALRAASDARHAVLVECLTMWLANLLGADLDVEAARAGLVRALEERAGPVVLISNEVGSGVVPANALARRFVDEAGRLHQELAEIADDVVLVTAGIGQRLKRSSA